MRRSGARRPSLVGQQKSSFDRCIRPSLADGGFVTVHVGEDNLRTRRAARGIANRHHTGDFVGIPPIGDERSILAGIGVDVGFLKP